MSVKTEGSSLLWEQLVLYMGIVYQLGDQWHSLKGTQLSVLFFVLSFVLVIILCSDFFFPAVDLEGIHQDEAFSSHCRIT